MEGSNKNLVNTRQKKFSLQKKPDSPGFNQSFFNVPNTFWYNYVINWLPHKKKPLIFLPCANASKTRKKYGKKMFSHSTTHQFLSAITRCEDFEKVVISEPLTIVPYALEGQHPDYDVSTEDLTIQDEIAFITRLANWLNIVKRKQPNRKYVYYIGGAHHYFIIRQALKEARYPFKLIYEVPESGVTGYSASARGFKEVILNLENHRIKPELMKSKELKSFLKKFRDLKPKKEEESKQTRFDLDLNLKENIDESKAGYNLKGLSKYKRFEFNQKNNKDQEENKNGK